MTDKISLARAALHFWEEPCISGGRGSGAVFFSGCSLGCVYCQNREISSGRVKKEITKERLAEIFFELKERGAHNINLVTPTHFIPSVADAISEAKTQGFDLPFVYNSGGYESVDALRQLDGLIDVYMPDFKYMSAALAKKYSAAENYPEAAKMAISEMFNQVGENEFDGEMMTRGLLVRHLLIPGCVSDSKAVVSYLYETYGDGIYMSLMNQFTPLDLSAYPEINRRVSDEEYDGLVSYALSLGVENAFIQEGGTAEESFIPAFDFEGV